MSVALDQVFDFMVEDWCNSLRWVYREAKALRAHELRGSYVKQFNPEGIHEESAWWGRITAAESLLPMLAELRLMDPPCSAITLRRVARRDAEVEFAAELIEQDGEGVFA